jgi:hypothetical protein
VFHCAFRIWWFRMGSLQAASVNGLIRKSWPRQCTVLRPRRAADHVRGVAHALVEWLAKAKLGWIVTAAISGVSPTRKQPVFAALTPSAATVHHRVATASSQSGSGKSFVSNSQSTVALLERYDEHAKLYWTSPRFSRRLSTRTNSGLSEARP